MESDEALVARATVHDRDAFDELVRRHQNRIHQLARVLTRGDDAAQDLVQEAFIRAYRGLSQFRGNSTFRTWLHRIAINVIRSYLARQASRHDLHFFDGNDPGRRDAATVVACPRDLESTLLQRQVINQSLSMLPPGARLVIVLRDVQGLEYSEIASILGVPIGTVESRIFRARRQLRPMLAPLVAHVMDRRERTASNRGPVQRRLVGMTGSRLSVGR
jgi:RNA polymerase sigma-70 factor (ECF subfamily)